MRRARLRRRPFWLVIAALAVVVLSLGQATAFPGGNGQIVFASDRDGDFDIFTIPGGGGTATQVVNAVGWDTQPAFSPDGSQIAYVHDGNIYVVAATTVGGAGTSLTSGAAADGEPHWSHDGTMIVFVRDDGIYAMTSAGGSITPLVATAAIERSPVWSPDGDRIAYESNASGNFEVYTANTDGGSATNVSQSPATSDTDPAWSPDGDKLAFIRDGDLWTMNEAGTGQVRLTTAGNVDSDPTWSPNGEQIAFAVTSGNDDVYVMPAGGGSATQFTSESSNDRQPDWGTSLASTVKPQISEGGVVPPAAPLSDGTTLTVVPGAFAPVNPPDRTYQWLSCNSGGEACTDISGATATSYTLTSSDIGFRIRVRETATTADGSASGISDPTVAVVSTAPDNIAKPTISPTGIVTVGQTLTAAPGTWKGSQPLTFAFHWRRCTSATDLATCTDIAGETATTYVLRSDDLGKFLRVKVTGSNAIGTANETSEPTEQVATAAPVNVVEPTITGTMRVGSVVSATAGTWNGVTPMTFTYKWRRCNADGTGCVDIAGATTTSYTIVAADSGKKLAVSVKATNSAGTATKETLAAQTVEANPPINSVRPTITGLARVGSVLTASTGSWTGTLPMTFTYQWRRCDADGENCVNVTGATASSYIPTAADVNRTILVTVTATNSGGPASTDSFETAAVTSTASSTSGPTTGPANTSLPRITGTAARGSLLVASPGSWTGTTPMTFSYQWQRCNATLSGCVAIARATLSTYRTVAEDVAKRLRVVVTAGNAAGSAVATSAATDAVKASSAPTTTTSGVTRRGTAKNDRLTGTAGNDTLLGLAGADTLLGLAGNDVLRGAGGNDRLDGGPGADSLFGDAGNDTLTGGFGRDRLAGGAGNDSFKVRDGEIDTVDCGAGRDLAVADTFDRLKGCERIQRAAFKKAVAKKTSKKKASTKKRKSTGSAAASSTASVLQAIRRATAWASRD